MRMRRSALALVAHIGLLLVTSPLAGGCRRLDMQGPGSARSSAKAPAGSFRFSPRPNHAADIHWQVWSQAAFDEARATGRPVLLSLAAVWCHWCHVLDETTLSDPRVIELLNRAFVTLRVDADQRPDLEHR